MPTVFLDSTDAGENMLRSMITDIAHDIMVVTKIPVKSLQYHGEIAQALTPGSTIDAGPAVQAFGKNALVQLTVTEVLDENGVYTSSMTQEEHLDIFTDLTLGVRVKPTYTAYSAVLDFTYRCASKSEAIAWRNTARSLLERDFLVMSHYPEYQYVIHPVALDILAHVHSLRETVAPYGESLGTYFSKHMSARVNVMTDRAGGNATFMVQERQIDVQGMFEFTLPPIESRAGEGSTWDVSFSYKVNYQKPTGYRVSYPTTVHNQLIGKDYRPLINLNNSLPVDNTVLSQTFGAFRAQPVTIGPARYPEYDDWVHRNPLRNVSWVLQLLTVVDDTDPTLLLDLNDLGPFTLKPELVDYINDINTDVFRYGLAPLHIQLYEETYPLDGDDLTVVDGKIHTTYTLNPRRVYHVMIGLIHDMSTLRSKAIESMITHPDATETMLTALEPRLSMEELLPTVVQGRLNRRELKVAFEYINTTSKYYKTNGYINRARLAYCTITTGRT